MIAEKDFVLDEDSKLLVLRKPFFALSIVNLLSGQSKGNDFEENQGNGRRPFTCEGVRVLAVDDEEMNLMVAKGVLGSYGIQVDTCLSGKAAVERCTQNEYDIIFLDHMMPGFDGVETLRRIRELNNGMFKDLPVIALTANTISGAREMFRNEGFTEFIPKPIERSVLERVLRRVLPDRCIEHDAVSFVPDNEPAGNGSAETPDAAENGQETAAGFAGTEEPLQEESLQEETSKSYGSLVRAGINVGLGMEYCSGEEEFYMEMLRMFHDQAEEKREEIIALFEAENWTDYAIKVHALKSTALTIGAEALSGQAKELELAGKEKKVEFIRKNHPLLLQKYEEICESIAKNLS